MPIDHLPPAPSAVEPPEYADENHPMRLVTRAVAFGGDAAWDRETREFVADLFDGLAPEWSATRDRPERLAALDDALERGGLRRPTRSGSKSRARVSPHPIVLELGSGTGLGTRSLARHFAGGVVALDLSAVMLRHAPAEYGARVRADAGLLPVRDGVCDVVVLVNALLFPGELNRVLAPGGALVWVNTVGENTPIHLPVEDVVVALGGQWDGVASRAGTGTWAVLRRGSP